MENVGDKESKSNHLNQTQNRPKKIKIKKCQKITSLFNNLEVLATFFLKHIEFQSYCNIVTFHSSDDFRWDCIIKI